MPKPLEIFYGNTYKKNLLKIGKREQQFQNTLSNIKNQPKKNPTSRKQK